LKLQRLLHVLRRFFPLALTAFLAAWVIWYLYRHPAAIDSVLKLTVDRLLLLFGLSLVKLGSMGLFTRVIVGSLGVDLGLAEWFGLSALSAMGNYLSPFRGGAALRAIYLKSKHGLSYPLFISTLSVLYVLTLCTSSALGLLALVGLYAVSGTAPGLLVSLFVALVVIPVAVLSFAKAIPLRMARESWQNDSPPDQHRLVAWTLQARNRLTATVSRIVAGWHVISSRRGTVAQLVGTSVLNASISMLMIHFSFASFGADLPLLQSLVLSNVFMLSSMIPLTPSGLGVAEVALVLTARGFVGDSALSTLSAGLNRSVMMFSSVLLGIPFSYLLGRNTLSAGRRLGGEES
jgi:uncharacterized protein (TIRG00374 family)